jgi:transposase-like protein
MRPLSRPGQPDISQTEDYPVYNFRAITAIHPAHTRNRPQSQRNFGLDELVPAALHIVEQYANNPIEADHGRLKARLRPMRGLKRHRSARILAAGHAFVQNLRRGHYDIVTDVPDHHRLRKAFDDLAITI